MKEHRQTPSPSKTESELFCRKSSAEWLYLLAVSNRTLPLLVHCRSLKYLAKKGRGEKSFPNLSFHTQLLEQAPLEQQRTSNWERQKRCVRILPYRSKGCDSTKLLLLFPFWDPRNIAQKLHYMWFFNYDYLFLLYLSLATEYSLAAFSSSELKYKLSQSVVQGPTPQRSL